MQNSTVKTFNLFLNALIRDFSTEGGDFDRQYKGISVSSKNDMLHFDLDGSELDDNANNNELLAIIRNYDNVLVKNNLDAFMEAVRVHSTDKNLPECEGTML